jgi:hypothetical protein
MNDIEKLQFELDSKMTLLAEINEQVGMVEADIDSIQKAIEALGG